MCLQPVSMEVQAVGHFRFEQPNPAGLPVFPEDSVSGECTADHKYGKVSVEWPLEQKLGATGFSAVLACRISD